MENIEQKWNTFYSQSHEKDIATQLHKMHTYETLKTESEHEFAAWSKKYEQYKSILHEENRPKGHTKDIQIKQICIEYTELQNKLETNIEQCDTEEQLEQVIQLWKKLDSLYTMITEHMQ